jgi:hypothetical protein
MPSLGGYQDCQAGAKSDRLLGARPAGNGINITIVRINEINPREWIIIIIEIIGPSL